MPGDVGRDGDDWDGPRDLPKLNLQFLSFGEYLERTSELYFLEAAHDIRAIPGSATVPRVLKRRALASVATATSCSGDTTQAVP